MVLTGMTHHEKFMERCLWLASAGAGAVAPNPMVGGVIVHRGRIIGEGFHREFGGPHAEVHAVNAVLRRELLRESTLYVTLEPCAHHGKTPPCADMIVAMGIPRVVIGIRDPFPQVAGRGVEKLQKAGIEVITGVLAGECREQNRRFLTFHENKRPYVTLKWAQTTDGFMDRERQPGEEGFPLWISGTMARVLVHRCRSQEAAILVGRVTAERDNPALTTRCWSGANPLRMVIDPRGVLPRHLRLFDHSVPTVVATESPGEEEENLSFLKISPHQGVPRQILAYLREMGKTSLIVEGGRKTLQAFIDAEMWDEAHIYTGPVRFGAGLPAPEIRGTTKASEWLGDTLLTVVRPGFQ